MKGLLVGYGSIGRRHLGNFHDLGVRDWAVVHTGMGTLPFEPPCAVRCYHDLYEALQSEEPCFAVVANPTNLHVPTALACIEAECHVLLEKPVSHTTDGLASLQSAAQHAGMNVLVGFQFRFHPALQKMRDLIASDVIGKPLHARALWGEYLPSWHPWEDWRESYAARLDLGGGVHHTICHPIDYLAMLFGDPTSVLASFAEARPLGLDVPEAADVVFRFPDGVGADLHLDYWTRPTAHRVDIVCTSGTMHWDYITGEFRVWDPKTTHWRREMLPGVDERNDLFIAEARHFLDLIGQRAEPMCTLEDGVRAVRLCIAIEESAARSEAVTPSR
jgi:predicted dehydrogenase